MNLSDTIVAIATPAGRGGLGVVRLSGTGSVPIAEKILHFRNSSPRWRPWASEFAELSDAEGNAIDQVVVSYFREPNSYTAEDVVEISCHGSPVVLRACVEGAVRNGARLAEPGEFTLRAYLRGRIDLPQAEAVRELIEATTLHQARVAAQQVSGSVSKRIQPVKEQLVELISLLEAGIDFAEDDVSVASDAQLMRRLGPIAAGAQRLLESYGSGRFVFTGFTLAILGRPNVGKSSLFNRLLEADRAIVTDIPGTTRDTISEQTAMEGIPVRLVDTAGIRGSGDLVESLGIERSYQAAADADLTLLVFDLSAEPHAEDQRLLKALGERRPILVGNKADLPRRRTGTDLTVLVSATTGEGINELRETIMNRLSPGGMASPESGSITSLRHHELLQETAAALDNARRAIEFHIPHEMLLIDLYAALRPLDAITGATTADDILNRIFSTFCIGK